MDGGGCAPCPAGTFRDGGTVTGTSGGGSICAACPVGTYQDDTGATSCKRCVGGIGEGRSKCVIRPDPQVIIVDRGESAGSGFLLFFLFTLFIVSVVLYCSFTHMAEVPDERYLPEVVTADLYEFEQGEGKWV